MMGEVVPVLGTYKEREIPEWIDAPDRGGRHFYDRIAVEDDGGAVPLAQLRADEIVVYPGLIYRRGCDPMRGISS